MLVVADGGAMSEVSVAVPVVDVGTVFVLEALVNDAELDEVKEVDVLEDELEETLAVADDVMEDVEPDVVVEGPVSEAEVEAEEVTREELLGPVVDALTEVAVDDADANVEDEELVVVGAVVALHTPAQTQSRYAA
jgi:hypothetical protein